MQKTRAARRFSTIREKPQGEGAKKTPHHCEGLKKGFRESSSVERLIKNKHLPKDADWGCCQPKSIWNIFIFPLKIFTKKILEEFKKQNMCENAIALKISIKVKVDVLKE